MIETIHSRYAAVRQCGIVRRHVSPIVAESCGRQNGVVVELVQLGQFWRTFQIERWSSSVQRVPVFRIDVYRVRRTEQGRWQSHAGRADYDLGPSPGITLQRHSIVSLTAQIPIAKHIAWIRRRVDRATPLPGARPDDLCDTAANQSDVHMASPNRICGESSSHPIRR